MGGCSGRPIEALYEAAKVFLKTHVHVQGVMYCVEVKGTTIKIDREGIRTLARRPYWISSPTP